MPRWFLPIGIGIATSAAIVASQALISGTFTLINEGMRMDFLPKGRIEYPTDIRGQLYIPMVNWLMCFGCIGIVLYFQESSKMEAAYGLAIVLTMLMTTTLLVYYLYLKKYSRILIWSVVLLFSTIEISFLIANLDKFKQKIADDFNRDIQLGRTPCWTEDGEPIRGGVPFENQRRKVPHITVLSGNDWLKENQYLETWEPVIPPPIQQPAKLDESTRATPAELIDAFEKWGLKRDWFKDLNSRKWLLDARKKIGKGQRRRSIQPLFCPHEVMQGLVHRVRNPKR
jgi:hypothetical protein